MLSNIDIIAKIKTMRIPNFRGVFSRDRLPQPIRHGSYIINMEAELDDRGRPNPGSHWVALYIDHKMDAYYFDSFGFAPPSDVEEYCQNLKHPLKYSTKEIQSIDSKVCGYYALYFCLYMSRYELLRASSDKFRLFLNQFSTNINLNKDKLGQYLGIAL